MVRENGIAVTSSARRPSGRRNCRCFRVDGLRVFGPAAPPPSSRRARSSPGVMLEVGIPTGGARYFDASGPALEYLKSLAPPYVIKATGLAAGKGVTIAATLAEAEQAVRENSTAKFSARRAAAS